MKLAIAAAPFIAYGCVLATTAHAEDNVDLFLGKISAIADTCNGYITYKTEAITLGVEMLRQKARGTVEYDSGYKAAIVAITQFGNVDVFCRAVPYTDTLSPIFNAKK